MALIRYASAAILATVIFGCASHHAESDSCCSADASASGKGTGHGWVALFDGKTTKGFHNFRSTTISPGWQVQDGALCRVAAGAGNIVTDGEYSNYELMFEWKVGPSSNSGVIFHVTEATDDGLISGPEYQILANAGHPDGRNPKTSAASNYALHAPIRDVTKQVGEWNQGKLVVNGDHVEHWLNGVKVVEYDLGNPEWKALVAASKFGQMPGYGTRRKGHIAFQDHGDPVCYRNIKIRELPSKDAHHDHKG